MSRLQLKPHPVTAKTPLRSLVADVTRVGSALTFRFVASGALSEIVVPRFATVHRADRLWEHTCFEGFLRVPGALRYFEFNFAPSGAYAVYAFDDYRAGMRSLELMPQIECTSTADELQLTASVDLRAVDSSLVTAALAIALSAVIENAAGERSYWALQHPDAKPDFHHRDAFVHTLEPAS